MAGKQLVQSSAFPKIVQTYRCISNRALAGLIDDKPAVFNGEVSIRRYEIAIREIAEPLEVLQERLLHLWRTTSYNTHHTGPLRDMAKELGIADPEEFLKSSERCQHRY